MAVMGRPKTPAYRKKSLRFSSVEDRIIEFIENAETEEERIIANRILTNLKSKVVKEGEKYGG